MVNLTLRLLSAVCVPACEHVCDRASICVCVWVCVCLHWTISCKLLCGYGLFCVCVCVFAISQGENACLIEVYLCILTKRLRFQLHRYTQVTLHEEQMVFLQVGERTQAWLQISARIYTSRLRHTGVLRFSLNSDRLNWRGHTMCILVNSSFLFFFFLVTKYVMIKEVFSFYWILMEQHNLCKKKGFKMFVLIINHAHMKAARAWGKRPSGELSDIV